jgi:hypothetical protein
MGSYPHHRPLACACGRHVLHTGGYMRYMHMHVHMHMHMHMHMHIGASGRLTDASLPADWGKAR